jgi:transcriptional regulator with XRE-family HTH domain
VPVEHLVDFPGWVRGIRRNLGLTQREFAKVLGTSKQTVVNWERGLAVPQLWCMRRLVALDATGTTCTGTRYTTTYPRIEGCGEEGYTQHIPTVRPREW